MKATPRPPQRRDRLVQHELVGQQDQHVRERGERVRERERGPRQHREPHEAPKPEQEEPRPDRAGSTRRPSATLRVRAAADPCSPSPGSCRASRVSCATAASATDTRISPINMTAVSFPSDSSRASGSVSGASGSQVLDLAPRRRRHAFLDAGHLDHLEQVALRLHVVEVAGRRGREPDRDPVLAGRVAGTRGCGTVRASSRRTDRSRCRAGDVRSWITEWFVAPSRIAKSTSRSSTGSFVRTSTWIVSGSSRSTDRPPSPEARISSTAAISASRVPSSATKLGSVARAARSASRAPRRRVAPSRGCRRGRASPRDRRRRERCRARA